MDNSAQQHQLLPPVTSTRTSHRSRFSMRFSLSSFLGGSSIYSNSPPLPNAVSPKPDRFRFTLNSVRDARTIPTPTTVRAMRPRSSTRSLIDAAISAAPGVEPLNAQRSWYGAAQPTTMPIEEEAELPSPTGLRLTLAETVIQQEDTSRPHRTRRRKQGRKITKAAFKDPKVRSKAALAIAFGSTFFIGLAVYLGLAIGNIGTGPIYHVIFILLILGLMAAFIHSLIRMFMLILRPRHHYRRHRRVRNILTTTSPSSSTKHEGLNPEKPFRIIIASDEDEEAALRSPEDIVPREKIPIIVRPPPPIYGEFKGSARMNPNLVHWKRSSQPPSPLTPTYDEAVRDVCAALGREYRPPSYISEHTQVGEPDVVGGNGGTGVREGPAQDGDRREGEERGRPLLFGEVHPLERDRVAGLIGIAR